LYTKNLSRRKRGGSKEGSYRLQEPSGQKREGKKRRGEKRGGRRNYSLMARKEKWGTKSIRVGGAWTSERRDHRKAYLFPTLYETKNVAYLIHIGTVCVGEHRGGEESP